MTGRRAAVAALACVLATATAGGRALLAHDEALALAFPGATAIERETCFLTAAELAHATELAGFPVEQEIWVRYRARRDGEHLGTAYFDTHVVRTLAETLLIVVGGDGRLARVEVVRFDEPADYLPRPKWYEQFRGRELDAELRQGRAIRPVTGATLSARAATAAVRRVLAVHRAASCGTSHGGAAEATP